MGDVGERGRQWISETRGVTTAAFRSALTMRDEPRRVARRKIALRISGGDSGKKPGLASGDEPPGGCARKFFYCQKSRLRVRGDGFLPTPISRNDGDRATSERCMNHGNDCGTGVSCSRFIFRDPKIANSPVKFPVSREFAWRRVRSALLRQPGSPVSVVKVVSV